MNESWSSSLYLWPHPPARLYLPSDHRINRELLCLSTSPFSFRNGLPSSSFKMRQRIVFSTYKVGKFWQLAYWKYYLFQKVKSNPRKKKKKLQTVLLRTCMYLEPETCSSLLVQHLFFINLVLVGLRVIWSTQHTRLNMFIGIQP